MSVEELNPQVNQVSRQITRDVYNRSYMVFALTMLSLVAFTGWMAGTFNTKMTEVNSTMNDVKAQQRIIMVYFNKQTKGDNDE